MTIFEQIRDMAKAAAEKTEIIAKNVSEKAEAALEIQKLSSEVSREQNIINQEYQKIGSKIYQTFVDNKEEVPDFLQENFTSIKNASVNIEQLNKKISEIKLSKLSINLPKIVCPQCKNEILANAKFCPECGHAISAETDAEAAPEEVKETVVVETEEVKPEPPAPAAEPAIEDAQIIKEDTEKTAEIKNDQPVQK